MSARRADAGAVTAELAVALPAVVLVLALLLVVGGAVAGGLRCTDAARVGARLAALGEDEVTVAAAARRVAGGSADVDVRRDGPWVEVVVRADGPAAWFGAVVGLSGRAVAWQEP